MKCFVILAYIFVLVYTSSVANHARVNTENGKLIGSTYTLPNGRTVYAFLGVPFAAPPIGRYRFEEPRPAKRWFGDRNATIPSKFCVQFFHRPKWPELLGEEDCLYLNIYTPRLPSKDPRKVRKLMNVLVYVFGGAFSAGSGRRIIPDYILQDENIVFVSISYRTGPFGEKVTFTFLFTCIGKPTAPVIGFFSSGDDTVPGNNGLKDQIEALKWLQKNIHNFGGDPSQVTVYGSSAGAASLQFLLLSPLSNGLFKNAILTSGSSLCPWALRKTVVENSIYLASSVKCPTFNTRLMMRCLKRKPVEKLYQASSEFFIDKVTTQIPFSPVIEPKSERAIITEHPYELLKKGRMRDVPLMVGVVEQDASVSLMGILHDKNKLTELNDKWYELAPSLLDYDYVKSSLRRDHISSAVRKYYFGNKTVSKRTSKELLKAFGDRLFMNGIIESSKLHSAAISSEMYCYKFYYRGTGSHCDHHPDPIKKNYGACHGDDQFYLISFTNRTQYNDNVKSKVDLDMVTLSTSSIIAFMKTGNPSTPDVHWQPLNKNGTMDCLNIYTYTHQRMLNIENAEDTKFWRDALQSEY